MGICNAAIGYLLPPPPAPPSRLKQNKYYCFLLRLISEKKSDNMIQAAQAYDMYLWIHLEINYVKLTII